MMSAGGMENGAAGGDWFECGTDHGPRLGTVPCVSFYSVLSARIGSVDAARRAGTIAAIVAASKSSSTLPPTASGSITGG